jgi:hypothetical protein
MVYAVPHDTIYQMLIPVSLNGTHTDSHTVLFIVLAICSKFDMFFIVVHL